MQATQNTVDSFLLLQRTQFVIPVYQRPYEWKQQQCRQLLDDILNASENPTVQSHFVGSIVFLRLSQTSTNIYSIIDGQQRLTSVILLLAALRKCAMERGEQDLAQEIYESYLTDKLISRGSNSIKLRPVKKDQEPLRSVIEGGTWSGYSHITENFAYFYERIGELSLETVKNGIEKLAFVEVGLKEGEDDPQRIFQSLNSTGLDLNQGDLLRNYILMDLQPSEQERLYERYWEPIERYTTEQRSNERKVPDFLRAFLTLHLREIPPERLVFETFKKHYSDKAKTEETLALLLEYADCYDALINPQNITDTRVSEHLKFMQNLSMTVTYPFLLAVCSDWKRDSISSAEFVAVLECIQSFVWRRFVCGVATNALNKIFMTLYKDIKPTDYLASLERSIVRRKGSQRFPDDDEFTRELSVRDMYNITTKNRLYFFERLENYGEAFPLKLEDNPEVSVEHIFPQKPAAAWKKELTGEEFEEMQTRINTVANLTLSPLAANIALSNHSFAEKRDMEKDGYKASNLRINKQLANFAVWNPVSLKEREKEVLKRCLEVWRYPSRQYEEPDTLDEISITDLEPNDATGRVLRYVLFGDVRLDKPTFADIFALVAKEIYKREASAFWETDLREKLGVTSDNTKWQTVLKIGEGCYVYRNSSASGIISKLQAILERCKTSDPLTLCFEPQLLLMDME